MSTTLLVVRHGQTDWNKDYRFRGRADLALSETGLQQAQLVAERLAAAFHPSAIYSSPLRRSIQTAEAIASRTGLKPEIEDGLVDLDFGQFSGLSRAEAESKFPEVYRMWLNAPHITRFPDGESLEDVRVRVTEVAERLSERYEGQQVVLVSHVDVIRTLLCSLLSKHMRSTSRMSRKAVTSRMRIFWSSILLTSRDVTKYRNSSPFWHTATKAATNKYSSRSGRM